MLPRGQDSVAQIRDPVARVIQSPPITQDFWGEWHAEMAHLSSQSGQEWTDFEGVRDEPNLLVKKE